MWKCLGRYVLLIRHCLLSRDQSRSSYIKNDNFSTSLRGIKSLWIFILKEDRLASYVRLNMNKFWAKKFKILFLMNFVFFSFKFFCLL